jgi:hypothetical protein
VTSAGEQSVRALPPSSLSEYEAAARWIAASVRSAAFSFVGRGENQ